MHTHTHTHARRYLYRVPGLAACLRGPSTFKPDIEVVAPLAYVTLAAADVTHPGTGAVAVAVLGKMQGCAGRGKVGGGLVAGGGLQAPCGGMGRDGAACILETRGGWSSWPVCSWQCV